MQPSENNEEDGGRKPTRPFLRKGEGTARFRMANNERRLQRESADYHKSPIESPAISLPRFTPSNGIPTSARTVDSGISNEDETRPPTTASLPMDNPSSSPLNHFDHQNMTTPSVIEEQDDSGRHVESEDHIERVSARQTFASREGTSSPVEPCSEVSTEAGDLRAHAERLRNLAPNVNSMKSYSTTPSSYASSMTPPKAQSTPKTFEEEETTFHPPPFEPSSYHQPISSLSSASLETPQARPFASNRANFAQNEAQTGISLLNNQPRRRVVPPSQQQAFSSSSQEQKENMNNDHIHDVSEHVYDQPLQGPGRHGKQLNEIEKRKKLEHNLKIQLRDAIAHLDYSSEEVWKTKKRLVEDFEKAKEKLSVARKDLEEEYRKKIESFQEDMKSEEERLQRERRELEREKKILQKGKGEREKELMTMNSTLREKLTNSETHNSKLRQDIRTLNDKLKKKDEEIEKITKDYNRSKSTCQTLEKRIKQLRNEKEKDEKEKELFAIAATNRKSPYPMALNQSLGTTTAITPSVVSTRNPSVSSLATNKKTNKGRTVSFADDPQEQSLEVLEDPIPSEPLMTLHETISTELGKCNLYKDALGETTRTYPTIASGILYEFQNGDFRWGNHPTSVLLEVLRPGDNATLISVKRREIRTELYGLDDGTYYTEVFDKTGRFVTKSIHEEVNKKINLGTPYSHRDNGARYVEYRTAFDDFELIEPEFRLRWYKGELMVCKIFKRPESNEKTLRFELNIVTGSVILETVEDQLKNGVSQKQTVFTWPHQKSITY
ncbi:CBN-SAS-4 protein [Caenorhabditis brenneri]|uniref:CBN-SAS-4 protein n=1 Tax=Caenorhabditis brenneri TaxID=135651 RepID=G0N5J5_CAEBE|nr:CBN-SAS-4 protein [Caenorhabditis brenneri]